MRLAIVALCLGVAYAESATEALFSPQLGATMRTSTIVTNPTGGSTTETP